ncbi:MAG TPA: MarC family NAAT transporter [Longimicrobiales bacterium]|nr:MarC family NAAT transporter [Longimicrobiales bacterium]
MNSEYIRFGTLAFTSLLAILNPLSAVPMYVALTSSYDRARRANVLRRAVLTAFLVMVLFTIAGRYILRFFGITTHAFQITGGIIFFGIGYEMLQARRSRTKTTEEEENEYAAKDDIAIIPLGMPSLAGPGTITTVIALDSQATTLAHHVGIYVSILLVTLIAWAVLAAAPFMLKRLGQTGMNIFTRVMGLIAMVIGAQFVINGVTVVVRNILS